MKKFRKKLTHLNLGQVNIITPVLIVFVLISVLSFFGIKQLILNNIELSAVQSARDTVQQLKHVRSYYTKNILKKVIGHEAIESDIHHMDVPNTIPLPATMIHDLGAIFTDDGHPIELYSPYPFPNRADRKLDQFANDAWQYLQKTPDKSFSQLEWKDGEPVVRVATADIFNSQICVDCHNSRLDTPKNDWKLNDVRGIMEVEIPIAEHLSNAYQRILSVVFSAISAMFLLIMFLLINIKRQARVQQGLQSIIGNSSTAMKQDNTESFINMISDQLYTLFPVKGDIKIFRSNSNDDCEQNFIDIASSDEFLSDEKNSNLLFKSQEKGKSIVANKTGVAYFGKGNLPGRFALFESKRRLDKLDANLLRMYAHNTSMSIKQQEQVKMHETLEMARNIQMGMLPTDFEAFSQKHQIDLHAFLSPAKEVGGDLYDFFELDNDHICLVLGDVSDKGVPASLFMTMTKTLIRSIAVNTLSPAEILTRVNDELSRDNNESMFVTVFLAIFNCKNGKLNFSNGGHNPPYIVRNDAELDILDQASGTALGIIPDLRYTNFEVRLEKNEGLFIYSDGINEAMNAEFAMYGLNRMEMMLIEDRQLDAETCISNIINSVRVFTRGMPQSDDMTILYLRSFIASPSPSPEFAVISSGHVIANESITEVKSKLSRLFKAPMEQIEFLISGKRTIIKKKLNEKSAKRYMESLRDVGLDCEIVKINIDT